MRVALAAARVRDRDLDFNLSQIKRYMREAKAAGAELVCFGEAYLQGFDAYCWQYEEDRKLAVSVQDELFLEICRETERIGIDLLFGFLEAEGDKLYSSCALIAEGQLHQLYRRISRGWKVYYKTDEHYCEGEEVPVFEYRGRRCCIALCGDLWDYAGRFRLGEDLLFWPVYCEWSLEQWESSERQEYAEKAQEACALTLFINPCDDAALGGCYVFADGAVKQELPMGQEGLLIADI